MKSLQKPTLFQDIVNIGPNCVERFIDSSNAPEIKDLSIELAGCSNLSAPYQVGRINPPNHTLFYSLKGSGFIHTPHGHLVVEQGSLAILPAMQSFEVTIQSSEWDIIWLNLADNDVWAHLRTQQARLIEDIQLEGLHHAMELLYLSDDTGHRQSLIPLIQAYLGRIVKPVTASSVPSRLMGLFSQVERQLQFNWSVELLSEQIHYSPPHLHRLCLSHFGRSPMQQVIFLRMMRAKTLLANTQWPVSYIANYVGYSNVFTFSKRFKKSTGLPPSVYREQQQPKAI
jgi:AraC-like DNA-binding protein